MIDANILSELLPSSYIHKIREITSDNKLAVYTNQEGFYKNNWTPLREYLRSINWDVLFILN